MKKNIGFLLLFTLFLELNARWPFNLFGAKKPFSIVLEASGDAINPGRTIFNNFENSICFTLAQQIKQILDANYIPARIYLNRTPTEIITPLQNAQFSNKLAADLYISIHCYQCNHPQARIHLYQFSYHDPIIIKKNSLGFYRADQIYLLNETQTTQWIHEFKKIISEQSEIEIHGVYALPFKPLLGIEASAFGIEIGIPHNANMNQIAYIISSALEEFIRRKNA